MKASDVIIITTNLEWANRFAHVDPVAESVALGAKIGSVEEGMADWDLTTEDIDRDRRARREGHGGHARAPSGAGSRRPPAPT